MYVCLRSVGIVVFIFIVIGIILLCWIIIKEIDVIIWIWVMNVVCIGWIIVVIVVCLLIGVIIELVIIIWIFIVICIRIFEDIYVWGFKYVGVRIRFECWIGIVIVIVFIGVILLCGLFWEGIIGIQVIIVVYVWVEDLVIYIFVIVILSRNDVVVIWVLIGFVNCFVIVFIFIVVVIIWRCCWKCV